MYTEKDIISKDNYKDFKNLIGKKVYCHDNIDELLEIANIQNTNCILKEVDTRVNYPFVVETFEKLYRDNNFTTLISKYIIVKKEN